MTTVQFDLPDEHLKYLLEVKEKEQYTTLAIAMREIIVWHNTHKSCCRPVKLFKSNCGKCTVKGKK